MKDIEEIRNEINEFLDSVKNANEINASQQEKYYQWYLDETKKVEKLSQWLNKVENNFIELKEEEMKEVILNRYKHIQGFYIDQIIKSEDGKNWTIIVNDDNSYSDNEITLEYRSNLYYKIEEPGDHIIVIGKNVYMLRWQ